MLHGRNSKRSGEQMQQSGALIWHVEIKDEHFIERYMQNWVMRSTVSVVQLSEDLDLDGWIVLR